MGFEFAEGFGMFARFPSTGLDAAGGERANDTFGCVRFLNNTGAGLGFHWMEFVPAFLRRILHLAGLL